MLEKVVVLKKLNQVTIPVAVVRALSPDRKIEGFRMNIVEGKIILDPIFQENKN